jgi:hypothetical protein
MEKQLPCTYNKKKPMMSGNVGYSSTCPHIFCKRLLTKHFWIASKVWFQSPEFERTRASSLAWHDQTQRPYTWTRKIKLWRQAKKHPYFQKLIQMKNSYLFKSIMVVSNSTSPSKVSNKIKFIDMGQDGSSLCNLLMYGIQA